MNVARAAGWLHEFGGYGNRLKVVLVAAQEDMVRVVHAINGRSFGAIDFRPFVVGAVFVVTLG